MRIRNDSAKLGIHASTVKAGRSEVETTRGEPEVLAPEVRTRKVTICKLQALTLLARQDLGKPARMPADAGAMFAKHLIFG